MNRPGGADEKLPKRSPLRCRRGRWLLLLCALGLLTARAFAQLPSVTSEQPVTGNESSTTLFPHPPDGRYWLSGQMNFVFQGSPPFNVQYSGAQSFSSLANKSEGRVLTLYTGYRFTKSQEVLVDVEGAGGLGLSSAVGIAGFTNLDAVRDATLTQTPYLARAMYHLVFPLSHDQPEATRGPLSTFSSLPSHRLELRAGKFGMTDFFDTNAVGGDSHLQFLNWAINQNGAYDFTADARGYTWGVLTEYQSPKWGARFAEGLMPGPKNGGPLVWNLSRANTSNAEFELHRGPVTKDGIIRVLAYVNHANMGIYSYANQQYLNGKVAVPDLSNHPLWVTAKYGFGLNLEQSLTRDTTLYARAGWNNGRTETWSFTEIDNTFSAGVGVLGHRWKRNNDRAGVAFATNGISSEHARYLSYGGIGSVLGDGGLQYGRENLVEGYYTAHLGRNLYVAPDLQYIARPGYNEVRGPVVVATLRFHVEL